jgi:glucokinase
LISVLGVDIGGTKVAAGPVDQAGTILAPPLVEPSCTESGDSFVSGLEATVRRALSEFRDFSPGVIGLACAGNVDFARGVMITSPNLPLIEVPLVALMREALGMPVTLDNDAKAAVLAEAVCGAAAGHRHVVMLTLGTGIGGGLFLDGRVYRGAEGGAGELGHTMAQKGGLLCGCGTHGCLEMYASGRALARYAAERAGDREADPEGTLLLLRERGELGGGAVAQLARQGYPGALAAVAELAGWLGVALVNVSNVFCPEMIVVGGGVAELGGMLLEPATKYMRENAMAPGRDTVRVAPAQLGNKAGLVGAGLSAWQAAEAPSLARA